MQETRPAEEPEDMPFIAPMPFDTPLPRARRAAGVRSGAELRTTTRSATASVQQPGCAATRRAVGARRARSAGIAA